MTSFRMSVTVLAVMHAVFAGFTALVGWRPSPPHRVPSRAKASISPWPWGKPLGGMSSKNPLTNRNLMRIVEPWRAEHP